MKIAISQRIDYLNQRNEFRDSIDQSVVDLFIQLDHIPLLVPNTLVKDGNNNKLINWLETFMPEGLILSGGNDIGQFLSRDQTEHTLLKWFSCKNFPILGICRGMQLIGTSYGSKLKEVSNHLRTNHKVVNTQNGAHAFKNSYHLYSLQECPANFEITHKSLDNEIEGIKHIEKKIYGIMWHPERKDQFMEDDINMIKKIFG